MSIITSGVSLSGRHHQEQLSQRRTATPWHGGYWRWFSGHGNLHGGASGFFFFGDPEHDTDPVGWVGVAGLTSDQKIAALNDLKDRIATGNPLCKRALSAAIADTSLHAGYSSSSSSSADSSDWG